MIYEEYNKDIDALIETLLRSGILFTGVYAVPRGGYYPAIRVANALNLKVVLNEEDIIMSTLIVDDLCDSGATMKKYAGKNMTAVVYKKERSIVEPNFVGRYVDEDSWIELPDEKGSTVEDNIRRIFEYIGEDPNRTGLQDTPERMVRMFKEIFRGYDPAQKPKITTFPNGEDGIVFDNMVVDKGDYYSLCEHHCRTFFGTYWFAYIPNPKGRILGLSKIGRVVDYCSARLQVQERLTRDIVEMLTEALGSEYPPLGMAIVMRGRHMCKEGRGARKKGTMSSSYLTGAFRDDSALRAEFMRFVDE